MCTEAVEHVVPVGAAPSWAALDRVRRYLFDELGPQRGPAGVGLTRARALFGALGDPQDRFRAVHVAGTAGKGSVSTFVASLLRAHGFRVGTHLSPHVHCLLERFQVDGRSAPAELVDAALARIRPAVEAVEQAGHGRPSFFEVTNAVAFSLFADRVDYGVVETGLGGLLDSTNTISRADKLAVVFYIKNQHPSKAWKLMEARLSAVATGETRPFALRMDHDEISPGASGTIAVITGEGAFKPENATEQLVLELFRSDGLKQAQVVLEQQIGRE